MALWVVAATIEAATPAALPATTETALPVGAMRGGLVLLWRGN